VTNRQKDRVTCKSFMLERINGKKVICLEKQVRVGLSSLLRRHTPWRHDYHHNNIQHNDTKGLCAQSHNYECQFCSVMLSHCAGVPIMMSVDFFDAVLSAIMLGVNF
jgi:hypothetical protein